MSYIDEPIKLDYDLNVIRMGDMVSVLHEEFIGQVVAMDPTSDLICVLAKDGNYRSFIADQVAAIN